MSYLVVDPFNENNAIGEDGTAMFAVRWLPLAEDTTTAPTPEQMDNAPILGYTEGIEGLEAISD